MYISGEKCMVIISLDMASAVGREIQVHFSREMCSHFYFPYSIENSVLDMHKAEVFEILGSMILIIFWYPKKARFLLFFRPKIA